MDHFPKWIGQLYLNRSHCLTRNRIVAANPSLGSCDSPLKRKPTLPSMELLTVKGTLYKIARTLDPNLHGAFNQNARPLARFRAGAN